MLMTTAGQIGIDLILNSTNFKRSLNNIQTQANNASSKISNSFSKIAKVVGTAFSVAMITRFSKECVSAANIQTEAETKLTTVMRQRMSASNKAISSVKNYASALQETGVVGDEVQLAGAQQLSTFLKTDDALKKLMPAMNNLAVQQNGVNVTSESMVNIGNLMGKVMQGQTSALTRVGITFSDAQAQVLKYGNEEQRAAMLSQVITDNVGNMNKTLANTPAGRIQQLKNSFGDMQETLGRGLNNVFSPMLGFLTKIVTKLSQVASGFENLTKKIFGDSNSEQSSAGMNNLSTGADDATASVDNNTKAINNNAKAKKKAERSLASFDKLNIITQNTSAAENKTQNLPSNLVNNNPLLNNNSAVDKAKNKVNALARSLKKLGFDKVKKSASLAFKNILDGIKQIANSWKNVWGNGTGKRLLSHINSLLSTAFGIVGDIASAFTQAWTKAGLGDSVVQSIIDRVDSLIQLIDTVGRDFRLAWNDGTGERIWSNILEYVRNTNNCIATFRRKIKEAWDKNGTGKKIWSDILGIVEDVTGFLKDMAKIRLDWLENLDLSPLLKSVEKLLGAFRRLSKACGEQLKSAYKNVLLPLAKWTIEKAVPGLVEMLGDALDFIGDVVSEISPSTLKGIAVGIAAVGTAVAVFKTGKAISDGIGAVSGALKGLMSAIEAHPVVAGLTAAASAITMLVGAIKSANETKMQDLGFTQATEEMSAYVDAITSCKQEINDLCGEMTNSLTETSNNMGVIDRYKDRLDKLLQKADLSPEEQAELTTIGDYFSAEYPEFKKAWNKYIKKNSNGTITITGKIDKVKANLDGLIEKYKQVAAASALSSLSETNTEGIVKAQGKFAKAAQSYKDAVGKLAEFESEWNLSDDKHKKSLYDDPGYYVWHNRGYYLDADDGHVVQTTGKQSTLSDLRDQYDKLKKKASEAKQAYLDTSKSTAQLEKDNSDLSKMQAVVNGNYKDATAVLMAYNASLISSSDIEKSRWKSLKNLRNAVKKSGKNAVYGYTDGISRKEINSVAKKGIEMAGGFIKALNGPYGLDEHSPSKKTKKSARYAVLGFNNGITDNLKTMQKPLQRMVNKIKSPFRNVGTWFSNIFKGAWNGIKSVFSGVGKWFKNLFNGILKFIKAPINFLIDGLNTLIKGVNKISFDVPKWVPSIGGKKFGFDIPQIPHLAKGGLVKAPTLAVVGDNMGASSGNPEVVSPLNKLKGMIQESSDNGDTEILSQILLYLKRLYEMFIIFRNKGGNTYEFVAKINGSDIFKEIVKQNELYKKRHNGKSAFV